MTDKILQQRFSELIYHLGEMHFNAVKTEFWDKHINKNEPFNKVQLEIFRDFINDFLEDL